MFKKPGTGKTAEQALADKADNLGSILGIYLVKGENFTLACCLMISFRVPSAGGYPCMLAHVLSHPCTHTYTHTYMRTHACTWTHPHQTYYLKCFSLLYIFMYGCMYVQMCAPTLAFKAGLTGTWVCCSGYAC